MKRAADPEQGTGAGTGAQRPTPGPHSPHMPQSHTRRLLSEAEAVNLKRPTAINDNGHEHEHEYGRRLIM